MKYRKNKEQILAAIIARLKTLPAGTRECTAGLFQDVFPDEPMPESKDLFNLDYAVRAQAEKNGLYLDDTQFFHMVLGLPYNVGFIVKQLKPVISFDIVRYGECTWSNLPEELTIDLRKKSIAYLPSDSVDREHPPPRKCTAAEWDEIADLAASCRFDQWDESYIEPVMDGTSWKIDLLKDGKVVKESSGSNGYPNCWRMFTFLKAYCRRLVMREAIVNKKPDKCPFCTSTNLRQYVFGLPTAEAFDSSKYILGGCEISDHNPKWGCIDCGAKFFKGDDPWETDYWYND